MVESVEGANSHRGSTFTTPLARTATLPTRSKTFQLSTQPPGSAPLVVIGAGVVGAATAFHAARAGLQPLVVEAREAPCLLTTPAATGAYRLQFDNKEELEMVRETVGLFQSFAETTGQSTYDLRLRAQGYIWATTDESRATQQQEIVRLQHSWGQNDIEILDGQEAHRRFPYLTSAVLQARYRAGDGFLDPKALTMGLLAGAEAQVVTRCRVTGFLTQGGRLTAVETSNGPIATEQAVIACGPFSGEVAALAEVHLPIEILRRHKVVVPEEPLVPPNAPMTIDDDNGTHWRPALAGAFLLYTDPTTLPTAPVEDVPADHNYAISILDPTSPLAAARIAPFWEEVWSKGVTNWLMQSGQYTMTPDHRPLLDQTNVEGLWINTGYSGHGIMGSPAGSRHLVDLITGKTDRATNPFRLDRNFEPRSKDLL